VSTAVLDKIRAERDDVRNAAVAMAEAEDFNPDDPTFSELKTRADTLDKRAATLADLFDKQAGADALDGRMAKASRRAETPPASYESPGELFTRSDAFTGYSFRGTSGRFFVDALQTRALPTGIADLIAAGYKGAPTRVDTTPPTAPTPLLDSMSSVTVSTNAIEYVAWTKKSGGAAKVAEKAAKPPAEFGPTVTSSTLDNIAVYTQLTRQLLEDESAARSAIDNLLRYDVLRAEEAEAGAVLAAAAAAIPDAVSVGDLLKAIRVGVGTVQAAGYTPNAVLLNPADWATLDIQVMGNANTAPNVVNVFWGLTPIPSVAQPAGTAIVGDFRSALTHYTRSQIALYITDSHDVTFLANVFTLLAERRSKTVLVRPTALCEAKNA
jgi:HK97 family phage major capsid protein